MTPNSNELEEVHVDLWGPYYPSLLFGNIYAVVFRCEFTQKT